MTNEPVQIMSAPVGANRWWQISLTDGGSAYNHEGTWELNGGVLTLFNKEGELVRVFGTTVWHSIQPTR